MSDLKYTVSPKIQASPTEQMIADRLQTRGYFFLQEVSFEGCVNPKTSHPLRFDFYLPDCNILIEYDGVDFHMSDEVKYRDGVKNRFAKSKGIRLIRIQGVYNIQRFFDGALSVKLPPVSKQQRQFAKANNKQQIKKKKHKPKPKKSVMDLLMLCASGPVKIKRC